MAINIQESLMQISRKAFLNERQSVKFLIPQAKQFSDNYNAIYSRAEEYVNKTRSQSGGISIENFIKEYGLDSKEGVMIMCLAEALLRIPDDDTIDELIKDKIQKLEWEKNVAGDQTLFINAATWSMMLTGKIIRISNVNGGVKGVLSHLIKTMGEPVIRKAVKQAMYFLGTQFIVGKDIQSALKRAQKLHSQGYLLSYDMLGEAAVTAGQAEAFYKSYMNAITNVGMDINQEKPIHLRPGISVKLSALHPRYELLQHEKVMAELLPKIKQIILHAKKNHIPVTIDAEESWRLDISLEIFNKLIKDKDFDGYDGLGIVVQAYQKTASHVLDFIIDLAKESKRYIPVRLVKGAYWDNEIKWAQEEGLEDYPVFTRKSHTDLSYFACANIAMDNVEHIYPQFATHNVLSVAGILEVAKQKNIPDTLYEFQRLYGMGEVFYNQMVATRCVRIYAPVGKYNELLPYLIRRLLENGANSSFVNMVVDKNAPLSILLRDPVNRSIENQMQGETEEKLIPSPKNIYGDRLNSSGYNLGNKQHLKNLRDIINNTNMSNINFDVKIKNVEEAVSDAAEGFKNWNEFPLEKRANILENIAEEIVNNRDQAIALLMNEAGKIIADAIAEVREAEDFCRYYAIQAKKSLAPITLKSPTGESNILTYEGKGVFLCISPWNFPMGIFTGQIVAAIVAGNSVIAKPAMQTPLIAKFIIKLMHKAGVPENALNLVIGKGSTAGEALVNSSKISGVAFTGSTEVAKHINIALAKRNAPISSLIAETGGQNAMIIDSSALLEQAVTDIINSAFGSAGQRCSALRILYVQNDIADSIITLLSGAIAELKVSNPLELDTDIGPVIDKNAQKNLLAHIDEMHKKARFVAKTDIRSSQGHFIAPHIFELEDASILEAENFGPILHIIRYKSNQINAVIDEVNNMGYGLTFGIHSRIDRRINYVKQHIRAGNIYVNRSMTGAVVGVQPFGGMGLSGTGPKAGGPNYLNRFTTEKTVTINTSAIGGNIDLYTGAK